MTTATRENPNLPGPCPGAERMVWPVKTHPAQSTGLESKKNSGDGEHFSLDFSFYRRGLPAKWDFRPAQRRRFSGIATLRPQRHRSPERQPSTTGRLFHLFQMISGSAIGALT